MRGIVGEGYHQSRLPLQEHPTVAITDDIQMTVGDCTTVIPTLPGGSVQSIITSPPYLGQRDYGVPPTAWPEIRYTPLSGAAPLTVPAAVQSLGEEATIEAFVAHLVHVFRLLREVLADDGTAWLNIGESYATTGGHTRQGDTSQRKGRANVAAQHAKKGMIPPGLKYKDMMAIPWRVGLALQADGWWLRSGVPWIKFNGTPESVVDRPAVNPESILLLTKQARYRYDAGAVKAPDRAGGVRLRRTSDWWFESARDAVAALRALADEIETAGLDGGSIHAEPDMPLTVLSSVCPSGLPPVHFAAFPPAMVRPCLLASTRVGDLVLDPFSGTGTVGEVCYRHGRRYHGIEIGEEFAKLTEVRIRRALPGTEDGGRMR